jgi:hypothetical protein
MFFFLVGMAFAGCGVWTIFAEIRRFRRTRIWPTVTGQIVDSQVTDDGETYHTLVKYHYTLYGSLFAGSANRTGVNGSKKQAENLCESYPVGRMLPIAYNPERAEQSEIADDAQRKIKFSVIFFGLFIIAFAILTTNQMIR